MSDRMEAPPRPSRAPVPRNQMPRMQSPGAPRRNRRRWAIAAAVTVCWVVLWTATGSLLGGTLVLLFLAALGVVALLALRALGVTRDHPWIQQFATRPWRDGQEVLQLALRHLPEVFVVTPSGALLAPISVELRLNPRDFGSLGERMDIGLVEASAVEVYAEQVAAHEARLAGPGPRAATSCARAVRWAPGFSRLRRPGSSPGLGICRRISRPPGSTPRWVSSRPGQAWVPGRTWVPGRARVRGQALVPVRVPEPAGRSPMTAAPRRPRCHPPPLPPSAAAAWPPSPSRPAAWSRRCG